MYRREDLITVELLENGAVVDENININKYQAAWFTHVLLENSYANPEKTQPTIRIRITGWHWVRASDGLVLTTFTCSRCHETVALEAGSYTDLRWDEAVCYNPEAGQHELDMIHTPNTTSG